MCGGCVVCGDHPSGLKQCVACKSVRYCGGEHQKEHWKTHKPICTGLKTLSTGAVGFVKQVITKPTNPDHKPNAMDTVTVHYTGTLPDGTVFDSSVKKGKPFQFQLGAQKVIRGWDEGVATMAKGEKARLIVGPEYAYGAGGVPGAIPPNSPLIFEVELLEF
eukprot:GFYU01001979.1.p1 GENE.GFYU01001979.1~~GFYU01001979.1.p1  ORF type:complete len:162 (-),score=50.90 GFYU01001979.1:127-612(-)